MLTLDDLITALPDARIGEAGPDRFTRASIDTRDLTGGELFFAIPGETRDGHDYLDAAVEAGAGGVVISRETAAVPPGVRVVRVPDVVDALQRAGAAVRARSDVTVVAVTGSAGKTTAKTMIAQALSAKYEVLANPGSYNNHLGVPLNLSMIEPGHTHVVAEIGTNHPGEIAHLAALAAPDIAVVTNVGWAHIGNFADQDALAAEKTDLLRAVRPGGTWIVNGDDPQLTRMLTLLPRPDGGTVIRFGFGPGNDVRAVDVEVTDTGTRGTIRVTSPEHPDPRDVPFALRPAGRHFAYAAMLAVAVADRCGIDPGTAVGVLGAAAPPPGRASLHRRDDGLLLLDDTYNASPDAMLSSLDLLAALPGALKIAVLGEMRELGTASADLHARVGAVAATAATHLVTVGDDALPLEEAALAGGLPPARIGRAGSALQALDAVRQILRDNPAVPASQTVVLAKGSRFRHMERIPLGLGVTGEALTVGCPRSLCTLYINCRRCELLPGGGR